MSTEYAQSRSLQDVGRPTEGQTLNRPAAVGWWWARTHQRANKAAPVSKWYAVEVIEENGRLGTEEPESGAFIPLHDGGCGWWQEWAGPLTPPVGPTARISDGEPNAT